MFWYVLTSFLVTQIQENLMQWHQDHVYWVLLHSHVTCQPNEAVPFSFQSGPQFTCVIQHYKIVRPWREDSCQSGPCHLLHRLLQGTVDVLWERLGDTWNGHEKSWSKMKTWWKTDENMAEWSNPEFIVAVCLAPCWMTWSFWQRTWRQLQVAKKFRVIYSWILVIRCVAIRIAAQKSLLSSPLQFMAVAMGCSIYMPPMWETAAAAVTPQTRHIFAQAICSLSGQERPRDIPGVHDSCYLYHLVAIVDL